MAGIMITPLTLAIGAGVAYLLFKDNKKVLRRLKRRARRR